MTGALVQLVSKGAQDAYLINNDGGSSLFRTVFTRHTNFAMAPRRLEFSGQVPQPNGTSSIFIKSWGDLVNYVWLEGVDLVGNSGLSGTVFDLYIGGQKIDSQSYEFLVYAWQMYQAESYTKSQVISSGISTTVSNHFMPLHFFFCDMQSFLPLLALQFHEVEIRVTWGPNVHDVDTITPYANYIFLDTAERKTMVEKPMEIIITQTQTLQFPIQAPLTTVDLSMLNHPVKTVFFGSTNPSKIPGVNTFTFRDAQLQLNGTEVFNSMTPLYFHVVQSFFHTSFATPNFDDDHNQPRYTLLYMYNFCLNSTSFRPSGTCNFSRLDNAKLVLNEVTSNQTDGYVYAVGYNIFKIQSGLGGILFGN